MEFSSIWIVLFLPLLGSIIQALFGKAVIAKLGVATGKRVMGALAVLPIAIAFAIGAMLTLKLAGEGHEAAHGHVLTLFPWIDLQSLKIPFEVVVDPLSMTMVLIITGIGALIHLYATGYMAEERDYPRFFTYLNLFVASMLILVLGNNLALMFIGWEGVGVCSYLLIGFWYKDVNNARAANKAFIVNRIGDWGLTLGMFALMTFMLAHAERLGLNTNDPRWLSYDVFLPNVVNLFEDYPAVATMVALLFFVGAMGKSAQFPLYFWLPDAMAGPTPVSALIHAATMVTAGVFMLNRVHPIFEMAPVAMAIVAGVGAFTAIFAALIAFGQTDIKKVLAYSTVSQLGFMFIACGVGAFWVGMFHVITHAFFKALLFLGSGAVIHAMAHDQDMRHYGNLAKYIKITAATMIIGWLAISGVPPLAGFWSKEAIIGNALGNHWAMIGETNVGMVTGWIALVVAVLTAAYMTRMTFLTFFGGKEQWRLLPEHGEHHGHEHHHAHDGHHADAHHEGHDHGPDAHGFFYTDEQMAAMPHEHEHHHALDPKHEPREVPPSMWIPLVALAILSVIGGYALYNNHVLEHWLYPNGLAYIPKEAVEGHPHGWVGQYLMAMGIGAGVLGILYGFIVYRRGLPKDERDEATWNPFRRAAGAQFGYDAALMDSSIEGGNVIATWMWRKLDAGLIDGIVNGVAWMGGQLGRLLRLFQTGFARTYALMMLGGGVALLIYFVMLAQRMGGRG
jgi:NADH-quinone oxidoreductase subunit L